MNKGRHNYDLMFAISTSEVERVCDIRLALGAEVEGMIRIAEASAALFLLFGFLVIWVVTP